ncbi:MAG: urate hydroxylase PuuD [Alphaproteobacteria bacterium]|nr:urate hydroxylase PuuD [Alphaproteobacteria bacterium]MCB9693379.1 urate hydroxylase PuuD [Alphaproteobacteria bacterium]
MDAWLNEWAQLLFRWVHVLAAIAWIGHAFFFHSMERALRPPEVEGVDPDVHGELWMVHGGGFFRMQKTRVLPPVFTGHLHWFKYEALFTWISGFLLLVLLYYVNHAIYMVPRVDGVSSGMAVGIGLATLVGGWAFYDFLWAGPVAKASKTAAAVLTVLMIACTGVALTFLLSGRAAFLHTGALLGTLMTANVWMRIIPGSKKMVAALEKGEEPDLRLGAVGHQRSVHNGYMHFPIVVLMISNHYAFLTDGPMSSVVLLLMLGLGAAVRQLFYDGWDAHIAVKGYVGAAAVALLALTFPSRPATVASTGDAPTFEEVRQIVDRRCVACHAKEPTHAAFTAPPKNLVLQADATILANRELIHTQAVVTKVMPLGNLTKMTDEERAILDAWHAAGSPGP